MRKLLLLGAGLMVATGWSQVASAQTTGLAEMEIGQLRPEVQRRYDEALAATQSPEYLAATDSRFMWASEAKAWCGIAIGFLKMSTRDTESLSRCDRFHAMMTIRTPEPQLQPAVVMPEPPRPMARNSTCDNELAATVFFEWDSSALPANIDETLSVAKANIASCGWNSFSIAGHADRSGSDGYNNPLSMRRAQAVAARMQSMGIAAAALKVAAKGESEPKVETPDGERNPANRRVEVTPQP
jgi:OmpA-OmpF porin, OOP family